jgi:glycosyltransferase involved in cell wall biosynthesis
VRLLTFTTLYPSRARPRHGIFVETRLREILRGGGIDAEVIAPVPWFPLASDRFGRYAQFARTARDETRDGIRVHYPRYMTLPRLGMLTAPYAIAQSAHATVAALRRDGFDFDLIDAHYFYPDGVAAALLARRLRKPLQITARGTDVNVLPQMALPRRMIAWAASRADSIVTVSEPLKQKLVGLGVDPSRINVLRNGVDCDRFRPLDRAEARNAAGVNTRYVLAAVGNLVPEKGHDLVIEALAQVPDATLLIVGEGPEAAKLREAAHRERVSGRVRFLPVRPQAALASIYSGADVFVLASSREGWPNVVLEAMACGTPVVATNVGSVSEIIATPETGIVVEERSAAALAAAIRTILARPPDREAPRRRALEFGWAEVAGRQRALFADAIRAHCAATTR